MKNKILLFFILLSFKSFSQKIFSVDYSSQADLKVFVTDYESQADLKVFKLDYQSQAKGNKGLWFFTKYQSQANKKIFFVDYIIKIKNYFIKFIKST